MPITMIVISTSITAVRTVMIKCSYHELYNVNLEMVHSELVNLVGYLFYNLSSVDIAAGYSPSVLNEMRTALHASRALSLNLTMNLPAGYTPLTLAEGFYMATMGGAQGTHAFTTSVFQRC